MVMVMPIHQGDRCGPASTAPTDKLGLLLLCVVHALLLCCCAGVCVCGGAYALSPCRVTVSLTTFHPCSLVEAPPASLPPLAEALTEAQHQQRLDEQQRAAVEDAQRAAQAAEVEAAAASARVLQEEYEASLPEDIRGRVAAVLEREAAAVRRQMQAQFEAAQAGLVARLAQLEARVNL